jgi:hypothetical protein
VLGSNPVCQVWGRGFRFGWHRFFQAYLLSDLSTRVSNSPANNYLVDGKSASAYAEFLIANGIQMVGKAIQSRIFRKLQKSVGPDSVVWEWSVRKGASDTFGDEATYAPRLDLAIGPFNTTFENRYEDARTIHREDGELVRRIHDVVMEQNNGNLFENPNPRCLIGIEVEYGTTSKHILGGITNASMLGRYAVIVGPSDNMKKIRRIHVYARKLIEVGKASRTMFGNVACLSQSEFMNLLR